MNCLKCPNYWKTDIDENLCNGCGTHGSVATATEVERTESEEEEV